MPALTQTLKRTVRQKGRIAAINGLLATSHVLDRAGFGRSATGLGAIFMLHHVRPADPRPFRPNEGLEITAETLAATLSMLKAQGRDFIALDEIPARLAGAGNGRPFAAFTLDDGYRNNAEIALPVFARFDAPFTIFVNAGFARRTHTMWWETAAELLNRTDEITIDLGAGPETLDVSGMTAKAAVFDRIIEATSTGDEKLAVARLDAAARKAGIDPMEIVARLTMDDRELAELARNRLVTLGAHTVSHRGLARLADDELEEELASSMAHVESLTGRKPTLFAYPYGNHRSVSDRVAGRIRALGMMAITTLPGMINPGFDAFQHLPRVSLNGQFQKPWQISALASGLPFKLIGK